MNPEEKRKHDERAATQQYIEQKLNAFGHGVDIRFSALERLTGELTDKLNMAMERIAHLEDRSRTEWD
jgi:hypothetical protein